MKSTDLAEKTEKAFNLVSNCIGYLLALTPLVFGYLIFGYITAKVLFICALSEILFACWLGLMILNKKYRIKVKSIFLSLGIFVLLLLLSSIFGVNQNMSFWSNFSRGTGIVFIIHLFILTLSATCIFSKRLWHHILLFVSFIGALVSLVIVCGYIGFLDKSLAIDYATIGNSSFLAAYLLFCLFFAIYLGFSKINKITFWFFEEKDTKFLMILSALCCFAGLILSTGRAAALSSIIGIILLIFLFLSFKIKNRKIQIIGRTLSIVSIIGIVFSIVSLNIYNSFLQKEFAKFATFTRPVVWQISSELVKEKPILGYGPENFEVIFASKVTPQLFYVSDGKEIRFDKAHSIIWDTLVSGGILGLISYLSIFVVTFLFLWKKRQDFWLFAVFSCLFVAYFLQNLTVFDSPITYFTFFLSLAFLSSFEIKEREEKRSLNNFKGSLIIVIIIALCFSFNYFVVQRYRVVSFATKIVYKDTSIEKKTDYLKQIEKTSNWNKSQIRELYAENIYDQKNATNTNFKLALDALLKTREENPNDFYNLTTIAEVAIHLNRLDIAEKVLQEAERINNKNVFLLEGLIELKIDQNKYEEALEISQRAIKMDPRIQYFYKYALKTAQLLDKDTLAEEYKTIIQERFGIPKP